MDPESWRQRWREGRIGFHLDRVNPNLAEFFPRLDPHAGEAVFVPLCGKSVDLEWLARNGHPVIGVEVSPIAVESFFTEQGRTPVHRSAGHCERWEDPPICIWCGDFFGLRVQDVTPARLFYDRASLIAMPEELRARYAAKLTALLPDAARGLLITFEYPQEVMAGPPFSVSEAEVMALYGDAFAIRRLARRDVLDEYRRFRELGLDTLTESVYLLERGKRAGDSDRS